MAKTVIPFGPQHPVLPEPVQLKLVMEDEKVVEALPAIGYVHRGLEKMAELKDFNQSVYIVERVCGMVKIFTNPREQLIEDYISGRFG
jgi:Ni,Fe-hydrogenase III large subunit